MCGPERIEVERDDTVRTGVLEFDSDGEWGAEVVVSCVWKLGDGPFENFQAIVQQITPARSRPGPKPSGSCNGSRPDTAEFVHSRTRYLSVLAYGDYRPVGGAGPLLAAVLSAAEIGEVGLACADGP
jgi:hypothetical protein